MTHSSPLISLRLLASLSTVGLLLGSPAQAFEPVEFAVSGENDDLTTQLRGASALLEAQVEEDVIAQDIFSAAQAEYGRLVNALYAQGYYSPVVHVFVDGREAADIAPLNAPPSITRVQVSVDPGPKFVFSRAVLAPLAQGTVLPEGFATGKTAQSGLVKQAVQAGVDGWRDVGHAKAAVAGQKVVADHRAHSLSAEVALNPGPKLRFGTLSVKGQERMRLNRILKIAGLPEGEVFDPDELSRAADRLRRTGVFKSVSLAESEQIRAPDLLDITATVLEEKRRRYSIGAEIASFEGATLSGYWLHRNLAGGGERLRIDGAIANIGAKTGGVDYSLGLTLDRPATFNPDTTASLKFNIEHLDEEDFTSDSGTFGLGLIRYFSENLTARAGIEYTYSTGTDSLGTDFTYRNLALPVGATYDSRDSALDAKKGYYLDVGAAPFLGFGITDSGLRLTLDGRAYRSFGEKRPVTFAVRGQMGAVFGTQLRSTPRDYLFYSGGGGSVRGQPYQSLGIPLTNSAGDEYKIGGTTFLAASTEVRATVTDTIGVVGFVDIGQIGISDFYGGDTDWHAGAGLGLRYNTGFGPIRLDVAAPVGGNTGDGVQIYVGIGQSF